MDAALGMGTEREIKGAEGDVHQSSSSSSSYHYSSQSQSQSQGYSGLRDRESTREKGRDSNSTENIDIQLFRR